MVDDAVVVDVDVAEHVDFDAVNGELVDVDVAVAPYVVAVAVGTADSVDS